QRVHAAEHQAGDQCIKQSQGSCGFSFIRTRRARMNDESDCVRARTSSRLPRGFRKTYRLRARLAGIHAEEIALLPLADGPAADTDGVLEPYRTDDGVERTAGDRLDGCSLVERTDLLDRLLQHLQSRVGERARPTIRFVLAQLHVALDVRAHRVGIGIPATDA